MTAQRLELTAFDRIAVVTAAISSCALLLELTWPHTLEPPAPAEQSPAEIPLTADDVVPVGPMSDYLSINERPLFNYDRKPFVFVEAAPVQVGPRAEFELTALIITSDTRLAFLRSNLTPTVQRVALNATIDGWTLFEVSSDSVVLRQNETSVTVPLWPDLGAARGGRAARIDPATSGN